MQPSITDERSALLLPVNTTDFDYFSKEVFEKLQCLSRERRRRQPARVEDFKAAPPAEKHKNSLSGFTAVPLFGLRRADGRIAGEISLRRGALCARRSADERGVLVVLPS
ncbi:hypothetical protein AAFF_G00341050 [Aldrovandia affinis]|uniref:Uncharacterized protein n=1 Tax=Aldrovandia affinis TaxID=143900 RepID=A0AAD7SLR1_9TELE|nr:hypothetical protein AAFF_G00341050 [Aldrovandia affinis]